MAGPPENVSPSELFLKLCEPQPTEVVDFPRRDARGNPIAQIRIQVLSQDEHEAAREDAHRKMKARGFDKDDLASHTIQEVVGDAVARELLAKVCLTVDGVDFDDPSKPTRYAHIFQTAEQLKKLRPDEIAMLFSQYLLTQSKYGPFEKFIGSEEDLNAWIKRLVEGGSAFPLLRLPLPQLVQLAFSLAERIYSLYGTLASQRSNLPPILASLLDGFSTDTTWSGGLAATSTEAGGANSNDAPVTSEQASRLTEELRDD